MNINSCTPIPTAGHVLVKVSKKLRLGMIAQILLQIYLASTHLLPLTTLSFGIYVLTLVTRFSIDYLGRKTWVKRTDRLR